MIYINAFIICGLICAIGQIILENTTLTPGHLNAILVITGALLSCFGLYEIMLSWGGAGASVPITNFGHLLFKGAYEGFQSDGMTGLLNGILSTSSGGLSITIIMAFIVAVFTKPQN
jgi:stage V sporulation protein AE